MNSKRKIAAISLVAMMLITAVGYAAISDSLTVNGSVGLASFNVEFAAVSFNTTGKNGTVNAEVAGDGSQAGDILNLSISNAMPGEEYAGTVSVANKGMSPAVMDLAALQASIPSLRSCEVSVDRIDATPKDKPIPPEGSAVYEVRVKIKNDAVDAAQGFSGSVERVSLNIVYTQVAP